MLSAHSMSFLGKTKPMSSSCLATALILLAFATSESSGQFFRGRQFGRQIGGGAAAAVGSDNGEECASGQYTHFELTILKLLLFNISIDHESFVEILNLH